MNEFIARRVEKVVCTHIRDPCKKRKEVKLKMLDEECLVFYPMECAIFSKESAKHLKFAALFAWRVFVDERGINCFLHRRERALTP